MPWTPLSTIYWECTETAPHCVRSTCWACLQKEVLPPNIVKLWSRNIGCYNYCIVLKLDRHLKLDLRFLCVSWATRTGRVIIMQQLPPEANLGVPSSAAVFAEFVRRPWMLSHSSWPETQLLWSSKSSTQRGSKKCCHFCTFNYVS